MFRAEKLRGYGYIRNRYVLRRADTLLWFWVVWTGAGRTTSRVGLIPSHEVRDSFVHPRRRDNRCQSRRSTPLDKRPEAAYYAVGQYIARRCSDRQSDVEEWCHGR